eukprot:750583-Hanusia_phi.AAC.2
MRLARLKRLDFIVQVATIRLIVSRRKGADKARRSSSLQQQQICITSMPSSIFMGRLLTKFSHEVEKKFLFHSPSPDTFPPDMIPRNLFLLSPLASPLPPYRSPFPAVDKLKSALSAALDLGRQTDTDHEAGSEERGGDTDWEAASCEDSGKQT